MNAGCPKDIDGLVEEILVTEGWPAFTDRANDRGGPTKGGITLKTLTNWRLARSGVTPTVEDLKRLEKPEAMRIYRELYVLQPGFDGIADPLLRHDVVDAGVLHGAGWAARRLQEIAGVAVDGLVGPITTAAVNGAEPLALHLRFVARRLQRIVKIARADPGQLAHLGGWTNRAVRFLLDEAAIAATD